VNVLIISDRWDLAGFDTPGVETGDCRCDDSCSRSKKTLLAPVVNDSP